MNTQNYPDWLVPLDIAKELKEIGFDEPCILYYDCRIGEVLYETMVVASERGAFTWYEPLEDFNFFHNEESKNSFIIPTWEQVFKWFREEIELSYSITFYTVKKRDESGLKTIFDYEGWWYRFESNLPNNPDFHEIKREYFSDTYEAAREALVLKLIKLYKEIEQ